MTFLLISPRSGAGRKFASLRAIADEIEARVYGEVHFLPIGEKVLNIEIHDAGMPPVKVDQFVALEE